MGDIKIKGSPTRFKIALNLDLLPKFGRKLFDSLPIIQKANYVGLGAGSGKQIFDAPSLAPTGDEHMMCKGNANIILGLDRPSNLFSGFGGLKNTHCAAIDIVAGRMGFRAKTSTPEGHGINVDPNFKLDAARIYISQKSDPDGYFGLAEGKCGNTSKESPRSTVALKADTVRLIARENIKLVTRTDANNSQGGKLDGGYTGAFGIDLIAMNDDTELQPLVKGDNLRNCLKGMMESIHDLRELFKNFVEYDRELGIAMAFHTHITELPGKPTSVSFTNGMPAGVEAFINKLTNVELQLNSHMFKLTTLQREYLTTPAGSEATGQDGKGLYILSKFNNTN